MTCPCLVSVGHPTSFLPLLSYMAGQLPPARLQLVRCPRSAIYSSIRIGSSCNLKVSPDCQHCLIRSSVRGFLPEMASTSYEALLCYVKLWHAM